jgi:hypothetical protein
VTHLRKRLQVVNVEEALLVAAVMTNVVNDLAVASAFQANTFGALAQRERRKHLLSQARPPGGFV